MRKNPRSARQFRKLGFQRLEGRRLLSSTEMVWYGQDNHDMVGPDASAGPDGIQDLHLGLTNLQPYHIVSVDVTIGSQASTPANWSYGPNPNVVSRAEVVRVVNQNPGSQFPYYMSDTSPTADLFINPPAGMTSFSTLTAVITYEHTDANNNTVYTTDTDTLSVGNYTFNPTLADVNPQTANLVPTQGGSAAYAGQYSSAQASNTSTGNAHNAGDLHVYLTSLPSPYTLNSIVSVQLSDPTFNGTQWTYQAGGGSNQSLMVQAPASQDNPSQSRVADLYFAPTRDEYNTPMTLLITVKDSSNQLHSFYTQFTINSHTDVNLRYPSYNAQAPTINVSPAGNDLISFHDPADTANPNSVTTTTLAQLIAGLNSNGQSIPSGEIHLYDNIHLTAGTYVIDSAPSAYPLVFTRPIMLSADPGVTILFTMNSVTSRQAMAPAFQIQSSHVHLSGFAVRFANPVYWASQNGLTGAIVGYIPTYSSSFENTHPNAMLVDLQINDIDLQAPVLPYAFATNQTQNLGGTLDLSNLPALGLPAQNLMTFWGASGTIENSTLRGGPITINGGPWTVIKNNYVGVVPTDQRFPANYANTSLANTVIPTYSYSLFISQEPHDLFIDSNTASVTPLVTNGVAAPAGLNFRFLYYSDHGYNNVASNNVIGQGMGRLVGSSSDSIYDPNLLSAPYGNPENAPEMFLNEDYHVYFEGTPLSISADHRILTIPSPSISFANLTWPITTGDVVSILTGPYAGHFALIAQVLDTSTYTQFLLNSDLPAGSYVISISAGEVGDVYRSNTVDLRGTTSTAFVIAGGSFGTSVVGNTILGDQSYVIDGNGFINTNAAIRILAMPSETANAGSGFGYVNQYMIPFYYTFNPVMGITVEDNIISGTLGGISASIATSAYETVGRVYISGTISNNQFINYTNAPVQSIDPKLETPSGTSLITIGNYGFRSVNPLHDLNGLVYSIDYANVDSNGNLVRTNGSLDPAADTTINGVAYNYTFADPHEIQLTMAGNTVVAPLGTTITKYMDVASATINGKAVVYGQSNWQTALANAAPPPPPPPPPTTPAGVPLRFDFGDVGTSVPTGYTLVTNFSAYTTSAGYGWTSVPYNDMNATQRGSVYATDMTFQVDLPNGFYSVTTTLGDVGPAALNAIRVAVQGGVANLVWTSAGQLATATYLAQVTNGHLTIRFFQNPETTNTIYVDSLTIAPASTPLQFQFGPSGTTTAAGSNAITNFTQYSSALGYGWTSVSNNMNAQTGMVYASDMTFQVDLPNGYYELTATLPAFPNATDTITLTLQGTQVGVVSTAPGTHPVVTYIAHVVDGHLRLELKGGGYDNLAAIQSLTILPLSFTFGAGGQNATPGTTAVNNLSTYTSTQEFGWTAAPNNDLNASPNGADFSTDMTFQVDLPNGYYDVTPTLGDLGGASTNGIQVVLQGGNVDTLWTGSGQLVTQTYLAHVSNGHLTLRFYINPTPNEVLYLDSLSIVPHSFPLQFQFGPSGTTVNSGYDAVSNFTGYTAASGYGFTAGNNLNAQTGMVYATDMTFQVDLPNGSYTVATQLAPLSNSADTATIYLQGSQVAVLSTGAGTHPSGSYVVNVTNGHLVLRVAAGGPDNFAALRNLVITPYTSSSPNIIASGSKSSSGGGGSIHADAVLSTNVSLVTPPAVATASASTSTVSNTAPVVSNPTSTVTSLPSGPSVFAKTSAGLAHALSLKSAHLLHFGSTRGTNVKNGASTRSTHIFANRKNLGRNHPHA